MVDVFWQDTIHLPRVRQRHVVHRPSPDSACNAGQGSGIDVGRNRLSGWLRWSRSAASAVMLFSAVVAGVVAAVPPPMPVSSTVEN